MKQKFVFNLSYYIYFFNERNITYVFSAVIYTRPKNLGKVMFVTVNTYKRKAYNYLCETF